MRQIHTGSADHNRMPEYVDTAYVVHFAVEAAIGTFMEHSEAAANGDVRGVHQSRVGLRRLRSHLRTFRRAIDIEWAAALSAEASWLADSLGAVRDLDVLKARLVEGAMLQVPEQAPAIAGLVALLETERTEALAKHLEVRRTARFTGLVGRLNEATRVMPGRPLGEEPAEYLIPKLLQRSWRELREAARAARKDPTIDNLHTVRIRAKRMRYANEAATPALGSPARRTARRVGDAPGETRRVARRVGGAFVAGARSDEAPRPCSGRGAPGGARDDGSRDCGVGLGIGVPRDQGRLAQDRSEGQEEQLSAALLELGLHPLAKTLAQLALPPPPSGDVAGEATYNKASEKDEYQRWVPSQEPEFDRYVLGILDDEDGDNTAQGE